MSDDVERIRDIIYRHCMPNEVGLRDWGKYENPVRPNIYVNKMVDVLNHDDGEAVSKHYLSDSQDRYAF